MSRLDRFDWLYLAGVLGGLTGLLASPWPWLAGLWFAACMFAAVGLSR